MRKEANDVLEELRSFLPDSPGADNIFGELSSLLKELYEEIDELEDDKKRLTDEQQDLYDKINALNNEIEDLEQELQTESRRISELEEELEDVNINGDTLNDQLKNSILSDMAQNLTLEQLEQAESFAVNQLKQSGQEYKSMTRVV